MSDVIERIETNDLNKRLILRLNPFYVDREGYHTESILSDSRAETEILQLAKIGQDIVKVFRADKTCPIEQMGFEADGQFCDERCLLKVSCELVLKMPLPEPPKNDKPSIKTIVYGFMDLSFVKRESILRKLSLLDQEDRGIDHVKILEKIMSKVKERNYMDVFWREIELAHSDRPEPPKGAE